MSNCRFIRKSRGFTLIELMLVVAITAITAALAIYSITAYLENARSAEAKNFVRAISKGAQSAYERESTGANVLVDGADVSEAHVACGSAQTVPATVQDKGQKYQPNTAEGSDFQTGDTTSGWKCVKFQTSQPIYYQYSYYWQDTAVTVAQQDWQREDWGQDGAGDRNFMPASYLMAAKTNDSGNADNNGKGTNKDGGIDGDGNNGHGNNDDQCDPDNPGKSGHTQCPGDAGNGSGDGSGDSNAGNDSDYGPAGNVEPWCVSNCFEAGAKSEDTIFLVVTELTEAGLQSRTVMMYRK